jgi:hypothetical protein
MARITRGTGTASPAMSRSGTTEMGAFSKVEDQAAAAWAQEGLKRANASGQEKLAGLLKAVRDDIVFELELFEAPRLVVSEVTEGG